MKSICKWAAWLSLAAAAVAAAAWALDRNGMLGVREVRQAELFPVNFSVRDQRSGAPVGGVRVKCVQKGNENACTTRQSHRRGDLRINIPVHYQVRKGLWSELERQWLPPEDPQIHLFFIHNDYIHQSQSFVLKELLARPGQTLPLSLQPRDWSDSAD